MNARAEDPKAFTTGERQVLHATRGPLPFVLIAALAGLGMLAIARWWSFNPLSVIQLIVLAVTLSISLVAAVGMAQAGRFVAALPDDEFAELTEAAAHKCGLSPRELRGLLVRHRTRALGAGS